MSAASSATIAARFPWPALLAWTLAAAPLALLVALLAAWLEPRPEIWRHLLAHRLADYLGNTLALAVGTGLVASALGIGLAWLVARHDFPGRRWCEPLLALPLALPTYVAAFVYAGLLDYAGPLATQARALGFVLPSPRGLVGASLILGLLFYPYVYLLCRAALRGGGLRCYEAARTLGAGPWRGFLGAVLPALRPAWVAGLILVLMETLADYGAVSVLGVETLTVGIFRVWHGMQSLEAAAQLATLLLLPVAMLLLAERRLGRAMPGGGEDGGRRIPLPPARAALALGVVLSVLAAALLIPLLAMIAWARAHPWPIARLLALATDTILLGAAVAAAVTTLGLALALCERAGQHAAPLRVAVALAGLGYALPGAVLAVGLLTLAVPLAQALGLSFLDIGSLALLLVALSLRFLRLGHGTAAAGLTRIRPSLGEAARSLGASRRRRLLALYLPMLRPSLAAAALLALLETMKELPATLLLRPFGWDTLAVRIHAYAAEGMWREAAMPGLVLVGLALPAAAWLLRQR